MNERKIKASPHSGHADCNAIVFEDCGEPIALYVRKDYAEHLVKRWNGYDWAIKRAQDLAKENVDLVKVCENLFVPAMLYKESLFKIDGKEKIIALLTTKLYKASVAIEAAKPTEQETEKGKNDGQDVS